MLENVDTTALRGFLDRVAADWEDDTARLVMADWLEESGVPDLAEFVRVGVEYAKCRKRLATTRCSQERLIELRSRHRELAHRLVPPKLWQVVKLVPTPGEPRRLNQVRSPLVSRGFLAHDRVVHTHSTRDWLTLLARPGQQAAHPNDLEYWMTGARVKLRCSAEALAAAEILWCTDGQGQAFHRLRGVRVRPRELYHAAAEDIITLLSTAKWLPYVEELFVDYLAFRGEGHAPLFEALKTQSRNIRRLGLARIWGVASDRVSALCSPAFTKLESFDPGRWLYELHPDDYRRIFFDSHLSAAYKAWLLRLQVRHYAEARWSLYVPPDSRVFDFIRDDALVRAEAYWMALGWRPSTLQLRRNAKPCLHLLTEIYRRVGVVQKLFPPLPQETLGGPPR